MAASAFFACAIESPFMEPEQSTTIFTLRGCVLDEAAEERLERGEHDVAGRVEVAERGRTLAALHAEVQHEVAIHDGARRVELDDRGVAVGAMTHLVRGAFEARVAEQPLDADRQAEAVLDGERGLRHLVRRERALAVAGRDGRGKEEPDRVARPPQHERVAEADRDALARHDVADVHRVEAGLGLLEHDGRVAVRDRVLVAFLGGLLLDHRAAQHALADRHLEAEEHGVERQREGVDGLDVGLAVVAVHLRDGRFRHEVAQGGLDRDVLERQGLAARRCHEARSDVHLHSSLVFP